MQKQPGGPTEVHTWIGNIFAEFRNLELQLLLSQVQSSLGGGRKEAGRKVR
jgi:hypothetical protein